MTIRWIFAAFAAFALVATGLVQGYWTDRWATDEAVRTAADLLGQVPMQIGDWEGKDIELPPGYQGVPGVAGSLQRHYRHRRQGVTVTLALVNGRPGPVATHTPEVCYGASGYQVGVKKPVDLDTIEPAAQFWTADAVKSRVTDETRLRLFWAWNGGQGWAAARDARQEFPRFRHPVLHKLYVLRDLAEQDTTKATDRDEPCVDFLNALLPVLQEKLFAQ